MSLVATEKRQTMYLSEKQFTKLLYITTSLSHHAIKMKEQYYYKLLAWFLGSGGQQEKALATKPEGQSLHGRRRDPIPGSCPLASTH